jgi:hypothetical protein
MLDPEGANLIGDLLYGIISNEHEVDYIRWTCEWRYPNNHQRGHAESSGKTDKGILCSRRN